MSADTLTDAQVRALRVLSVGPCYVHGRRTESFPLPKPMTRTNAHHPVSSIPTAGYVNGRAAQGLEDRGLAAYGLAGFGGRLSITPAGREALAAHEARHEARHEAGDRRG